MKSFQNKIIAVLALLTIFTLVGISAYAQPGSPEDPMVSRSYVNARIAELELQIAHLTTIVEAGAIRQPEQNHGRDIPIVSRELFTIVRAEPGMTIIGGASAEIILRWGEATVVAGDNGLANITAGRDIMDGEVVPLNNLIIVPQPDGRGLRFHTAAYLMIKGDFHFV